MRPPGMRPTTPPCDARTIFGVPFAACPNRGPSGRVRVSSLTKMKRGSSSCTSISGSVPAKTRALLSASAICAKWLVSVNRPMEKALPWVCGSCAQPSWSVFGTPSKPLMMCRLMSGLSLMALRVSSATMPSGVLRALPKGLVSVVLWGCLLWLMSCRTPCMAWLSMVRPWCGWCADGDAGVRCDMWAILSIQCDMQPLE